MKGTKDEEKKQTFKSLFPLLRPSSVPTLLCPSAYSPAWHRPVTSDQPRLLCNEPVPARGDHTATAATAHLTPLNINLSPPGCWLGEGGQGTDGDQVTGGSGTIQRGHTMAQDIEQDFSVANKWIHDNCIVIFWVEHCNPCIIPAGAKYPHDYPYL